MSETTDAAAPKKRGGGLSTMLLADLKSLAGGLGVAGAGSMKKAQLIEAIKGAQSGGGPAGAGGAPAAATSTSTVTTRSARARKKTAPQPEVTQPEVTQAEVTPPTQAEPQQRESKQREAQQREARQPEPKQDTQEAKQPDKQPDKQSDKQPDKQPDGSDQSGDGEQEGGRRNRRRRGRDRANRDGQQGGGQGGQGNQGGQNAGQNGNQGGQEGGGRQRGQREPDTTVLEDDVLVPAAGILDVLDNYAFVRTSGYLPGVDDVYLSLSMVRKYALRRGDAVLGQVRQPRDGERREKFNPMVRIDSVNGADPEQARTRVDFAALTPVHPTERLRLETGPQDVVGRLVDLAAPIGKGQRGLVVAPASAGTTTLLRSIATSLSTNHPECHLMVVLVDERPEEITDFERTVKGEVIASSFDRPPADHTVVAELAIERAKRLVELGHDVVVLLDGITRLGRAYNLAGTANGRVAAGALDPAALYPPKRFFGAARSIEDGGSLTILATAVVDTGSSTDELIFEEFEGTANSELRLWREPGQRFGRDEQVVPAVDVVRSGTRRDDLLMSPEEQAVVGRLRDQLATLAPEKAHADLLARLRASQTNIELLGRLR